MNVFKLGRIFKALLEAIRVTERQFFPNPVSPENLIERFSNQLEFGDNQTTMKVARDAVRIVSRMNRDWMVAGRRPSGICGAALILAARMNNFRRSVREVVLVVKVGELTVQKRLQEFKSTDSGKLTVEGFRSTDLEKEHDPPAFTNGQKKKKTKLKSKKRKVAELEEEDESEQSGHPSNTKGRRDKDGFRIPDIPIDPALRSADASGEKAADEVLESDLTAALTEMEALSNKIDGHSASTDRSQPSDQTDPIDPSITGRMSPPSTQKQSDTPQPSIERSMPPPARPISPPASQALESECRSSPSQSPASRANSVAMSEPENARTSAPPPTKKRKTTKIPAKRAKKIIEVPEESGDEEESHNPYPTPIKPIEEIPDTEIIPDEEFLGDLEIDNCLLAPDEIAIKERIWVTENWDWLKKQHAKKMQQQLAEANGTDKKSIKRPRKRGRMGDLRYMNGQGPDGDRTSSGASSPGEATRKMLEKRAFSRKINYASLDSLYSTRPDDARSQADSGSQSESRAATPAAQSAAEEGTEEAAGPEDEEPEEDLEMEDVAEADNQTIANAFGDYEEEEEEEEEEE